MITTPRRSSRSARPGPPRQLVAVLLTGMLVLGLAACRTAGANPTSDEGFTLRVGTTSVTGTPAGTIGWGDRQGILAEQLKAVGVEKIEYSFFQSGKEIVTALISGAVDVAAVGDNPALTAKGNGADITLLTLDSYNDDMFLIGAKGGPTEIDGLVGKTVTAPQGTQRDRSVRQLIDAAGLKDRIEVSDLATPESIAGLKSGKVAATAVGGASAVQLVHEGHPVIDKISAHGLGGVGTNVAQTKFVQDHPGFAEAWQQAIVAVNADVLDNFDAYVSWVAETDGIDVEIEREAIERDTFNTEPFPAEGLDQLQSTLEFLITDGTVEQSFDVAAWAAETPGSKQ